MSNETPDPVHGRNAERWGGWTWREPSRGEHFRTCSHCGSIHPEDLAAEDNWHAEWADAKYGWPHKFYVAIRNRNPEQRFILTADDREEHHNVGNYTWVRADSIPDDVITDGWRDISQHYRWVGLRTRTTHHAKFYTAHLADPTVASDAAEVVQRVSGLRLDFRDGHVTWQHYEPTA